MLVENETIDIKKEKKRIGLSEVSKETLKKIKERARGDGDRKQWLKFLNKLLNLWSFEFGAHIDY